MKRCALNTVSRSDAARMRRKLDALWSKAVRSAFGWRCIVCGGPATDAHHLRGKKSHPALRWEPLNGVALCRRHHNQIEANPKLVHVLLEHLPEHKKKYEETYTCLNGWKYQEDSIVKRIAEFNRAVEDTGLYSRDS